MNNSQKKKWCTPLYKITSKVFMPNKEPKKEINCLENKEKEI